MPFLIHVIRVALPGMLASLVVLVAGLPCPAQSLTPAEALARMSPADGLQVQLVAAEPLVRQPVAMEFDDRGRLWVIQYLQYPNPEGLSRVQVDRYSRTKYDRVPQPPPHGPRGADRITILEDTDGDGRMDHGHDFVSGLNLATGLAFGYRGVFVLNVPYLLFYPDRDRDDVPDSDPEVLLSGFGMEDAHSVANSLTWGPDGWLYGCQGSTVTANIRGVEFQQGVWRYHPVTREFELFCEGGGNSWGLDFDRTGNLYYSTNYGGYVLLHGVQGGYYVKSFAKHGELHNPHAYGYFPHAPHTNFRGGHVTVGGIVYEGGSLPARLQGKYIAGDLLGHGVYWHDIKSHGSTVRTIHGGELLLAHDPWFAPTDVTYGPDGSIYVADWHDARTAHPDPDADWDRSNGRIYRLSSTQQSSQESPTVGSPLNITSLSTEQLLALHGHRNQWFVRRARMELAYRSVHADESEFDVVAIRESLQNRVLNARQEVEALEALWSLAVTDGVDESLSDRLLNSSHPAVRAWTVRLLGDREHITNEMAKRLDVLAETEPAVLVRQQLASTARRLPAKQALPIINSHINRDLDHGDPFLPLLWWWAVERHSCDGREEVLRRFERPSLWQSRLGRETLLPRLIRRYAAAGTEDGLASVNRLLKAAPTLELRAQLWPAVLAGWKQGPSDSLTPKPPSRPTFEAREFRKLVAAGWDANPADLVLTELAIMLNIAKAEAAVRHEAFDSSVPTERRAALLHLLAGTTDEQLAKQALEIIRTQPSQTLQRAALALLARCESASVTKSLLDLYRESNSASLRPQIVDILLSRADSARVFLSAVDREELPATSIPLEQIRRVRLLDDAELDALVKKHWGRVQAASPGEKLAEVRRLNNDLRAGPGDAVAGRQVFRKHCASCHRLFDEGKRPGPDLTSANRLDRDFLLISLVDPDSVIRNEYMSVIVQTTDGRVLTGLPISNDDSSITLVDGKSQQPLTIERAEIARMRASEVSLMPSELYKQFSPQQLRDLFAFLQSQSAEVTR